MSNSIAENIANFLKEYSPFNYLSHDELIQVATSIGVVNLDKHKIQQINHSFRGETNDNDPNLNCCLYRRCKP